MEKSSDHELEENTRSGLQRSPDNNTLDDNKNSPLLQKVERSSGVRKSANSPPIGEEERGDRPCLILNVMVGLGFAVTVAMCAFYFLARVLLG